MQKTRLKNGLTILLEKRPTKSVVLLITVKTGSNNEHLNKRGISHFIEHMLFEGTKNRTQKQIADEIEKLGGELNAATSTERTIYYAVTQKKHFDKAFDVLSDMLQNPLFDQKAIEKERKVILEEIKLTIDQPRFYQWILFQKTLFKKHPAKNPVYGTSEIIKRLTRQDLLDYYKSYYNPNNISISIVGNIKNPIKKIQQAFNFKIKKLPKLKLPKEPKQKKQRTIEKRNIMHSYIVLGYKVPNRKSKDSYTLDIIKTILGVGQSSKLFTEIRSKRGLAYEIGAHYEGAATYGFFAIFLSTDKRNINKSIKIILKELKNLQNLTAEELKEAKQQIEGQFTLQNEDNKNFADLLSFYELIGKPDLAKQYIKNLKKVTLKDIKKLAKKYLNKNYTLVILGQK